MSLDTVTQSKQPSTSGLVEWTVDPSHTSVTFGVRHMMVSTVRGTFHKVAGSVGFDPKNPETSWASLEVDIASIDTREPKRDDHLRSADFFDAASFPKMTFKSTKIARKGDDELELTGDLTIKDITHPVTFLVTDLTGEHADPWGFIRMGASAKAKIKRSDYKMTWNAALEAGGVVVGDEVKIEIEVELQRQK
ncbi:MAG: YceI family protein [Labilithrix sp.]